MLGNGRWGDPTEGSPATTILLLPTQDTPEEGAEPRGHGQERLVAVGLFAPNKYTYSATTKKQTCSKCTNAVKLWLKHTLVNSIAKMFIHPKQQSKRTNNTRQLNE